VAYNNSSQMHVQQFIQVRYSWE